MLRMPALIFLAAALSLPFAAGAQDKQDDPVVATYAGQEIRRSEVEALHQAQYPQAPLESIFDRLVDTIVNDRLLAKAAVDAKLFEDPRVSEYLKRKELEYLAMVYLQRRVEAVIDENLLKQAYQDYLKELPEQEEAHGFHIEVASRDEADAVLAELNKGADFAALAKERSTGPYAEGGGDLGYITPDLIPPEFVAPLFDLEKGALSETPTKIGDRWHIFKVADRRPASPPSLEQVKGLLYRQLRLKVMSNVLDELRAEAQVTRFTMDGKPLEQP